MEKTVTVQGKAITVSEARRLVVELSEALSKVDPVTTDIPANEPMWVVQDPRWWGEPAAENSGTLLCFRDPGLGWRGFVLPWPSAAELAKLIVSQLTLAATGQNPADQGVTGKIH